MSGEIRSGCIVRDVIAQEKTETHIHCDSCELIGCNGLQIPAVLPPKDPAPEWVRHARMEGRAEFLALLIDTSPDSFANDHIGSHAIGDTGDYSEHWETQKLAAMFEVDEPVRSYIERIEGVYWSQQNRIDTLKDERDRLKQDAARLDWFEAKKALIHWGPDLGFRYYPERDSVITDKSLRQLIDKAMEIEAADNETK